LIQLLSFLSPTVISTYRNYQFFQGVPRQGFTQFQGSAISLCHARSRTKRQDIIDARSSASITRRVQGCSYSSRPRCSVGWFDWAHWRTGREMVVSSWRRNLTRISRECCFPFPCNSTSAVSLHC